MFPMKQLFDASFVTRLYYRRLTATLAGVVEGRFWHDFAHHDVLLEPFRATAAFLAGPVEQGLVDGLANGLAHLAHSSSVKLRQTQTGYVRHYALSILLGVVAIVGWLVLRQG
jgi:NADH-quinone oxidoreductase subunit L